MMDEELLKDTNLLMKRGVAEKHMHRILNEAGYSEVDIKKAIDTIKERNVAMKRIIYEADAEEEYMRRSARSDSFFKRIFRKIF